ncbi:MAG TPA: STAS domain-containing protein [Actinomycetota bacterium]|nr:STAS domain-containing protein [Actinomycetota bacterium]
MTTTLVLPSRIARGDMAALCVRVRALLEPRTGAIVCDVGTLSHPDAATVEVLARLQLTARAAGCRLFLARTCNELEALISLVGLVDVLPVMAGSGLEAVGQPEEREQVRGVEKECDPSDVIA